MGGFLSDPDGHQRVCVYPMNHFSNYPDRALSRREMLRRSGVGFGGLALSAMLAEQAMAASAVGLGGRHHVQETAFSGACQARDLFIDARRPVACGFFRLQAAPVER